MTNHLPKAMLFDWDNTLVDSWPIIHGALHKTFEAMGHAPLSLEDVKAGKHGIHRALRDSFPDIFGEEWEEAKALYYEHFLATHLDNIRLLPDVLELLDVLADTDVYLSVVSNKTGEYLRKEVTHLGCDQYFTKVIGAQDAKRDKPATDPVHLALDGSDIVASESVWFIGDSMTDIECAINAECVPVLLGEKDVLKGVSDVEVKHFATHRALTDFIQQKV